MANFAKKVGIVLVVGGVWLVGACDSSTNKRIADSDSIFGIIPGPSRPIDAVRDMADPFDPGKRLRGMLLIANAPFGGEEPYVKYYLSALGGIDGQPADKDPGVRAVAARAVALHGKPEHVRLILPLLDPKRDRVERLEAARALQRLHNDIAIDPLIKATRPPRVDPNLARRDDNQSGEPEADIRAEACIALGQYPQNKVLQALITAVDDDQLLVNRAAQNSLKILTGEDFGDDKRKWLGWLEGTKTPFAGQKPYFYPIFQRDKTWVEYLPFVSPPPNEIPGRPIGIDRQ